jgi:hypothetical protein
LYEKDVSNCYCLGAWHFVIICPTKTVYSHSGKKYFYKIEYDLNNDGKNDIALLVDENTGKFASLDVVRSTWPLVPNVGSQQWLDTKKTAATQFWNNRSAGNATCDICSDGVARGVGYVLTSHDILSNIGYVNLTLPKLEAMNSFTRRMLGSSYDPVQSALSFWQTAFESSVNTNWFLCDDCIKEWIALKK